MVIGRWVGPGDGGSAATDMDTMTWEPPGPGPWTQDSAHNPVSQTRLIHEIHPAGFNNGFTEAFAGDGVLARHRELGTVDLAALDDPALREHLSACTSHVTEMVYQHHRYNCHALVPVGDFLLHTAGWTNRPPMSLFGVFDGYSPVSNVSSPEIQSAIVAPRADPEALALLDSDGDPAAILTGLRARVPAVDDYVANVHVRLIEGFDVDNPTIGERTDVLVGRLRAAVAITGTPSIDRAEALASSLRAEVPAEHQDTSDEQLADARLVYRLHDERGIYSEISAIGLVRLAWLEFGRRPADAARIAEAEYVFELGAAEIDAMVAGSAEPTSAELELRRAMRAQLTLEGPPPPAPPPLEMLPPPTARVMAAVGFSLDGILGHLDEPAGTSSSIIGIAGAAGTYEGTARLVRSVDDLLTLQPGEVLVAPTTGEAFNSMLHLVAAIVTDHGSSASHAAIVSREMGIAAVVGPVNATARIPNGARVRVDGTAGTVDIL